MIPPAISLLASLFLAAKVPAPEGPVWTKIGTKSGPATPKSDWSWSHDSRP
ncbi:MAG: hypothetical protein IPN71_13665 [Fibrobacteres bacterium]|nr:hypothetical protein [Fibrobacterota bacterium]